ncbi:DUF3160 domain-containing protein [archaeon]|nr:DUF3160 domain-containing protein [archaeon]
MKCPGVWSCEEGKCKYDCVETPITNCETDEECPFKCYEEGTGFPKGGYPQCCKEGKCVACSGLTGVWPCLKECGAECADYNDCSEGEICDTDSCTCKKAETVTAGSFVDFYSPIETTVDEQIPEYDLPLSTTGGLLGGGDVYNYDDFTSKIELSSEAVSKLEENGFVIIDYPFSNNQNHITTPYGKLKDEEVPIFITTDSLLHLYHIQFDETLRIIEEREFYDAIWDVSKALQENAQEEYETSEGEIKEAAKKNLAYLSVGIELLKPTENQLCEGDEYECNPDYHEDFPYFTQEDLDEYSFEIPNTVKENVEKELALIEAHQGFIESPIFTYKEDYSQYIPRGHYTRSEKLKNYFKAMMWYGRISFLLKGCEDKCLVTEEEARLQTMAAAMNADYLKNHETELTKWDRIYDVTSFYVGFSDDLGPYEYNEAINHVFGGTFEPTKLNAESTSQLKAKLAEYQTPEIYGGTGNCIILPPFNPEQADECLESTKGFRMMGQRFIPDSYMFQNLVFPYVGNYQGDKEPFTKVMSDAGPIRGFPRGLDVMALLGSARARELLDELDDSNYVNYTGKYGELEEEFNSFTEEDWNQNLYWAWLYALKPLLKEYDEGYPTFMQTTAWQEKEMTTALASWAELRHDTILYAKQSYTMAGTSMPPTPPRVVGYVEPVPEFYARLLSLTRMTNQGLDEREVLDEKSKSRLDNLETILEKLLDLSEKELENKELEDEDYDFIKNFGNQLNGVIQGVDDKAKKTTIIADVHTDGNSLNVLEEGVGYVKMIVVAYKVPNGNIFVGAGPVLSYYEFKQPMNDRLTDEKWREILQESPPEEPEWIKNFAV